MDRKTIEKCRKEIDKIDNEMFRLIKKRFKISQEIGKIKENNNNRVMDKKREKKIIDDKIKEFEFSKKLVKNIYKPILNESKRLQKNKII